MTHVFKPIAHTNDFIILNDYQCISQTDRHYQSEEELENELMTDLSQQGYECIAQSDLKTNLKTQIERLNNVHFSADEWQRFNNEYLNRPNEGKKEKTHKIHNDWRYTFTFDNGEMKNIAIIDKEDLTRNHLQVTRQVWQQGINGMNRYDVTILINGLPMVQIELKRRGVAIREAFQQIQRYQNDSFNYQDSLYQFLQMFIISNGTHTRYFANTTERSKDNFDFTMHWAKADNTPIHDLKDFCATFLQKNTLLKLIVHYSVLSVDGHLLIMRPYQIAATERILWQIQHTANANLWSKDHSGGYIWHTTGSGKTLTSFKTAQLAQALPEVDKVLFVVDRKDLDYQTVKEYKRFQEDCVSSTQNTQALKEHLESDSDKIIITTIQKLNNLVKSHQQLSCYQKKVVFIFDECHRSQFGEAQHNIRRKFKQFCQFGFTGTPIFPENALGFEITQDVFGKALHQYVITHAIQDEKVLKFKVDYNDVRAQFKSLEQETDLAIINDNEKALLHPQRIQEICQYVLDKFPEKTHRNYLNKNGFNAMFAVSSIEAAKSYYETFKHLQKDSEQVLKIATIFSCNASAASPSGEINDENFSTDGLSLSNRAFLGRAVDDYNQMFGCSFSAGTSKDFYNYYQDLSRRVKNREVDLLIVVGMFLTGFDAPRLNTLFVDKNLRYHGLIQAFSRTNRIFDASKTFGNIVTFRDLQEATKDALKLFASTQNRDDELILLERDYLSHMEGFCNAISGEDQKGLIRIIKELKERFPNPEHITLEADKKDFVRLFGDYLRAESCLNNFDEYQALKALQKKNINTPEEIEAFKKAFYLNDETFAILQATPPLLNEREAQNYLSCYKDLYEKNKLERTKADQKDPIDWDDVVFEVELLKSQELDLDYILGLLYEKKDDADLKESISSVLKVHQPAKEELIMDFIETSNLDEFTSQASVIEAFRPFAHEKLNEDAQTIIQENNLKEEESKAYINRSLKKGFADDRGTDLENIFHGKHSPMDKKAREKKQSVFQKIQKLVRKFTGITLL